LGLEDDKKVEEEITLLINTRDFAKTLKQGAEIQFLHIVEQFKILDTKTINSNLGSKINYEIGETYYELAVYLKKEEIQLKQSETSKVEQEKTESVDISEVESNRINYVVSYFYYYNKWDGNNWFIKDTSGRPLEGYIKNFESYDIGLLNFVGRFLQSGYTKITLECQNYIKELDISQLSSRNSQSIINWIKVNSKDCLKTVVTSKDITSQNKVVEECKIEYNRKLVPTDYWFTFSNGNWYYGTVSILGLSLDVTIVNAQSKVDKEFYVPIIYNLFNPVKKDLSKSNFENDLFNPDEKSIGEPDFEDGLNFLIDYAKNIENKDQLIIHKGENKLKLEGDYLTVDNILYFCGFNTNDFLFGSDKYSISEDNRQPEETLLIPLITFTNNQGDLIPLFKSSSVYYLIRYYNIGGFELFSSPYPDGIPNRNSILSLSKEGINHVDLDEDDVRDVDIYYENTQLRIIFFDYNLKSIFNNKIISDVSIQESDYILPSGLTDIERGKIISETSKLYRNNINFDLIFGSYDFAKWVEEGYLTNYPNLGYPINPFEKQSVSFSAYIKMLENYYKYLETKNAVYAKRALAEAEFSYTLSPNSDYSLILLKRMGILNEELQKI